MKQLVLLTGIVIGITTLISSCNQESDCDKGSDPNACPCYEIYAPVCGCDGVTYANDCRAECAGISDYTSGSCH